MPCGAYSTTEAAVVARVSPQVIRRAIDAGDLKGFRIPPQKPGGGRGFRRVTRESLLAWLRRNGMPTDLLEAEPCP